MKEVTIIPGDGIGPEIIDSAKKIIEATGVDIEWVHALAGECAHSELGDPLPQETLDTIARTGVALKGPCGTPIGKGFRSVNVYLRQELGLYACVRPCKQYKGVRTFHEGVPVDLRSDHRSGGTQRRGGRSRSVERCR